MLQENIFKYYNTTIKRFLKTEENILNNLKMAVNIFENLKMCFSKSGQVIEFVKNYLENSSNHY